MALNCWKRQSITASRPVHNLVTKGNNMGYKLNHIDTCTSPYFRGHHLPVVQVIVDENTTYQDIKLSLLDTYYSIDHIEDIDSDKYVEAVHDLFSNFTSLSYVPDTLYEVGSMEDCDEWDLYMYFVIETVEEDEND